MTTEITSGKSTAAQPAQAEGAGAPGNGIEITPEMIETGVSVFWDYYPESAARGRTDRQMIREMLLAVRRQSNRVR